MNKKLVVLFSSKELRLRIPRLGQTNLLDFSVGALLRPTHLARFEKKKVSRAAPGVRGRALLQKDSK